MQVALRHLSEEETERLVVWIAQWVGRAQALAGDRGPYGRLDHVTRHWLSEGQRSALLCWLMRRIALGQSPVAGGSPPQTAARVAARAAGAAGVAFRRVPRTVAGDR